MAYLSIKYLGSQVLKESDRLHFHALPTKPGSSVNNSNKTKHCSLVKIPKKSISKIIHLCFPLFFKKKSIAKGKSIIKKYYRGWSSLQMHFKQHGISFIGLHYTSGSPGALQKQQLASLGSSTFKFNYSAPLASHSVPGTEQ